MKWINKVIEYIKYLFTGTQGKTIAYMLLMLFVAIYWMWNVYITNGVLTEFPAQVLKFTIGASMLLLYDIIVLKETDTNEMVKQNNNWGLLMLALAVIWLGSGFKIG